MGEQSIREHIHAQPVPRLFLDFHERLQEEYKKIHNNHVIPVIRAALLKQIAKKLRTFNEPILEQCFNIISGWGNVLFFPDKIFNSVNENYSPRNADDIHDFYCEVAAL